MLLILPQPVAPQATAEEPGAHALLLPDEMQTAAMEREYARAVSISIWTIEAISQRVGHDFHRFHKVPPGVFLPILSRIDCHALKAP